MPSGHGKTDVTQDHVVVECQGHMLEHDDWHVSAGGITARRRYHVLTHTSQGATTHGSTTSEMGMANRTVRRYACSPPGPASGMPVGPHPIVRSHHEPAD